MRTPQLKNLELSRLPKLPKAARSVNFKRTTPGSSAILASHGARQERHEMLDPAHPAAHLPLIARQKLCPRWLANSKLKLYGFPKAFLTKPAVRYSDPPFPLQPFPESGLPTRRRPNVALGFVLMRNDVKLDAPLRFKIKRRIRAAAELIISRGAHAVEVPGGGWRVEFDARDAGAKRWLVPDWCYVARPTNEMYRTSLAETVHLLRQGMQLIRDRALKLEATWAHMSVGQRQHSRVPRNGGSAHEHSKTPRGPPQKPNQSFPRQFKRVYPPLQRAPTTVHQDRPSYDRGPAGRQRRSPTPPS